MNIPGYDSRINGVGKSKVGETKSDAKTSKKESEKSSSASSSTEASTVSVSSKARDIQRANEIAKSSPEIRSEKVDRIAKQIRSGTYHVDSKDIAEKMLKDVLSQ